MNIVIVTHYFPPEIGAPQARLSDLARLWTEAGDEVTVMTAMPNHPTGVIPAGYRGKLRVREHLDGYRVLRSWVYATPNEGVAKKTAGHLSFMVSCLLFNFLRVGKADVVVVSSPTFFSIFSGLLLAKLKRARFVIEVRDLWPAIFVELGVLTNRRIIALLERIELALYARADAVVVVTEGFKEDLVRRGVPAAKVHTIRNGVDVRKFAPREGDEAARARLGAAAGDTLVLYIGAHGISQGLSSIADAAALLEDAPIHLAFVGEGAAKKDLRARVAALGLTNVTLLPGVERDEVADVVAAADICLVPLRDVPLFSSFIPSKIFEYFAMGKAVVGSVRGEPAAILRAGGAEVVAPGAPAALAEAVRSLAADPARRRAMGERARAYVTTGFDRASLARTYRRVLREVAGGGPQLRAVGSPRDGAAPASAAAR